MIWKYREERKIPNLVFNVICFSFSRKAKLWVEATCENCDSSCERTLYQTYRFILKWKTKAVIKFLILREPEYVDVWVCDITSSSPECGDSLQKWLNTLSPWICESMRLLLQIIALLKVSQHNNNTAVSLCVSQQNSVWCPQETQQHHVIYRHFSGNINVCIHSPG